MGRVPAEGACQGNAGAASHRGTGPAVGGAPRQVRRHARLSSRANPVSPTRLDQRSFLAVVAVKSGSLFATQSTNVRTFGLARHAVFSGGCVTSLKRCPRHDVPTESVAVRLAAAPITVSVTTPTRLSDSKLEYAAARLSPADNRTSKLNEWQVSGSVQGRVNGCIWVLADKLCSNEPHARPVMGTSDPMLGIRVWQEAELMTNRFFVSSAVRAHQSPEKHRRRFRVQR